MQSVREWRIHRRSSAKEHHRAPACRPCAPIKQAPPATQGLASRRVAGSGKTVYQAGASGTEGLSGQQLVDALQTGKGLFQGVVALCEMETNEVVHRLAEEG